VLREPRFRLVIRIRWISNLQRTSRPYAGIDTPLYRASFALDSENLLGASNTDCGAGEVDKDTDAGWEAGVVRVRDGAWVVGDECTELVGVAGWEVVFQAEAGGVAVCWDYFRSDLVEAHPRKTS
jgi:hypothetical protein